MENGKGRVFPFVEGVGMFEAGDELGTRVSVHANDSCR